MQFFGKRKIQVNINVAHPRVKKGSIIGEEKSVLLFFYEGFLGEHSRAPRGRFLCEKSSLILQLERLSSPLGKENNFLNDTENHHETVRLGIQEFF